MFILFFVAGLCWSTVAFSEHKQDVLPSQFERVSLRLTGTVSGLPTQQGGDWKFWFRIHDTPDNPALGSVIGKRVQLSCYRCSLKFSPGQHWSLTVRLKRPHGYASWGAYDYEKYLFRHRIVARGYIRLKEPHALLGSSDSILGRWRQSIQQKLTNQSQSAVGFGIIRALTIGDKSGLNRDQKSVFQKTGVSHLMAISGMHVGLVFLFAGWTTSMLLWPIARTFETIPRQHLVLLPALGAAFAYSALAGFAVSTQRALVMLVVYSVCRLLGRDIGLFRLLLVAATGLLIYDPFSVLDYGFWLSCAAVLIISHVSRSQTKVGLLRLQPALWLGMLPLSVLFFGKVSLISPLVNLVVVPLFCLLLIPLTLTSLVLLELGCERLAGWMFALLNQGFSRVYDGLAWVADWPFADQLTTPFVWWQWVLVAVLSVSHLIRCRPAMLLWPLLLGSLFVNTAPGVKNDQLRVVLLDVGQGLAMVIETANSVTVYDTGPKYSSGFTTASAVLLPYLNHRGITEVDTLIISHADNDHIGGLSEVLDAVSVGQVFTSRVDKIPFANQCTDKIRWKRGATQFGFLGPGPDTPQGSNNRSCVLKVEHFGTRLLLSGDIEKQVERHMLNTLTAAQLRAEVLLIPHQGSKTSSTTDFIDRVKPELALVAAGYRNHYGHPHPTVMARYHQRGIPVLSTVDAGSILINADKHGWRASTYRRREQRFWHYQKVSNPGG